MKKLKMILNKKRVDKDKQTCERREEYHKEDLKIGNLHIDIVKKAGEMVRGIIRKVA